MFGLGGGDRFCTKRLWLTAWERGGFFLFTAFSSKQPFSVCPSNLRGNGFGRKEGGEGKFCPIIRRQTKVSEWVAGLLWAMLDNLFVFGLTAKEEAKTLFLGETVPAHFYRGADRC